MKLALARRPAKIRRNLKTLRYSPQLDGLRGTAILCVLTGHLFESHFRGAWIGVDIFFVLSGFLITNILIAEQESTGAISLKNFYGRRALRLLPALFIGIAMTGLLSFFGATPFHSVGAFTDAAIPSLFYFSNFSDAQMGTFIHTWSLSVEEQFYLIWPIVVGLVLLTLKPRNRIALIVILMAAFAAIRFDLEAQHIRWWNLYSWFYTRADVLMAGALVACATAAWPQSISSAVRKLKPLLLVAIPFVAYVYYNIFADQRWLYRWGLSAIAVSCALIIVVAQFDTNGLLARILRTKILIWFGKHSYGIYVYHMQIFWMFRHVLPFPQTRMGILIATVAKVATALTLAWASYRWIEKPALGLKDKLFTTKPAAAPLRPAPAAAVVT